MKKNILIWGSKSKFKIIEKLLRNPNKELKKGFPNIKNSKNLSLKFKYLFDPKGSGFKIDKNIKFSNKKKDLIKFIKDSIFFTVCIGAEFGKTRYFISKKLERLNLLPIPIISKFSYIDDTAKIGRGSQIMPNAVVNCYTKIGDYCILNTSSTIDHECTIGNGVHVMGGASISGRVKIGNYVTIGTNSTILPDIKISEGAFIGAGAVVTKDVRKNQIVVGNPAKFLKFNKENVNLNIFNGLM